MTSVLNYLDNTSCNPINHLPSSQQNLPLDSTINPETTILVQPPSSNRVKPSRSLLSKRVDAKELGDLLTKKLKTVSTNLSDNGSNQHSPTSKKSFGLDSMTDTSSADSPQTAETHTMIQEDPSADGFHASKPLIRIPPFDSHSIPLVAQEGLSHFAWDISGDLSPERMTILESHQRVQQALSELHRRMMIEEQAMLLQELLLQVPLSQDLLNIPSFLPSLPVVNEAPVNEKKEKKVQNNKKNAKKSEEEEMEFVYGSIEFPFLSLSLPLGNEEAQKNTAFSLEPAKLPSSLTSISEGAKQAALEMRDSLCATRAGTQRSESDAGSSMKDLIEEKKTIKPTGAKKKENKEKVAKKIFEVIKKEEKALKIKKDKEQLKVKVNEKQGEKEKERQKEQSKNEDLLSELYPARAYFQRRNADRRKNRWQIAQDEKLKNEGIQIPDLTELLEGGKRKIVETPVGPEYQVDVCMFPIKSQTNIRRQPKTKWNPETHSLGEMQKFFVSLRNTFRCNIVQEKAIQILVENDNDIKKALEYVKTNKAKCLGQLTINADN